MMSLPGEARALPQNDVDTGKLDHRQLLIHYGLATHHRGPKTLLGVDVLYYQSGCGRGLRPLRWEEPAEKKCGCRGRENRGKNGESEGSSKRIADLPYREIRRPVRPLKSVPPCTRDNRWHGLRGNYFLSFLGFFVSFFWFMPLAIDCSPFQQVIALRAENEDAFHCRSVSLPRAASNSQL